MAGGTPPAFPGAMPSIEAFLREMIERGASDLHLTTNSPPMIRLHGELVALAHPPLSSTDTKNLSYSLLTEAQKKKFEEESELDFSFGIKGVSRFRGNLYLQKGAVGGAYRMIPHQTPQLQTLGLPPSVPELTGLPRGLVLVTGPTGSGKSTTLAAMVDKINRERHEHIVTVEDPIEFVHEHKSCLVNQREVFSDTQSFTQMQVGQSKFGMQTMSQALIGLVQRNLITPDEAVANATEADEVRMMLGQQTARRVG